MTSAVTETPAKPLAYIVFGAYKGEPEKNDIDGYRSLVFMFQSIAHINNALLEIHIALQSQDVEKHLKSKTKRFIQNAVDATTPDVSVLMKWLINAYESGYYLSDSDIENIIGIVAEIKNKNRELKYIHGIAEHELYRIGPQLKRHRLERQFDLLNRNVEKVLAYKKDEEEECRD